MIQRYTQPVMQTHFFREMLVEEVPLVPDDNGKWCKFADLPESVRDPLKVMERGSDLLVIVEMTRLLRFVLDKGDKPIHLSDGWREDAQAIIRKAPMNPWRLPLGAEK